MSLIKSKFHADVANLVGKIITDKKLLKSLGNTDEFILVARHVAEGLPEVIDVMMEHRNIKFTSMQDAPAIHTTRQATPFDQLFIGS
jgi:hypothetical protein